MNFSINEDQLALREAVKRFCIEEYPIEQRGNATTPECQKQRRTAMAELGLFGLPLSSEVGGSELGAVEVMLVSQELGEALGDGAFVASSVMAGQLLSRLGNAEQQQRWLPAMANGQVLMSMAVYEPGTRYDWYHCATQASAAESGWLLNGHKSLVLEGDSADVLLVVARTSGNTSNRLGLSVFAVNVNTVGVNMQGFETLDNRRAAHITFNNVCLDADRLIGPLDEAADAIEAVLDAATAALCAEAVGAVEALLSYTAEHLRTRKQFGSPLAKFQVLQHRVADIAICLEQFKSMACAAAMAVEADEPMQRRRLVSAAKVLASQKGREIGLTAIQLHGAMGMTDECRVGHYAKRLMVIGQTFGDAAWHLQRLRTPNIV